MVFLRTLEFAQCLSVLRLRNIENEDSPEKYHVFLWQYYHAYSFIGRKNQSSDEARDP